MAIEIARLREPGLAYFTLVRLFTSMGPIVLCQSRAVCKSLATNITFIWPVTRVCPHVGGNRRGLGEAPVTDRTLEGFFSTVCSKMGSKVGSLSE